MRSTQAFRFVPFFLSSLCSLCICCESLAEAPVASYIFPPGGQRGKAIDIRVGGLFLHGKCGFEMLGTGVEADKELRGVPTRWIEGPLLPLPDSQQAEDYPRDVAGKVRIAADAPLGTRPWRVWTSQGATPSLRFVVGDLQEIVKDDDTVGPVEVQLPITANARIFPRERVDVYTFTAQKGQTICCEVVAARLGSPLDARVEVRDAQGRRLAENDDHFGADPFARFTAPADGKYEVRVLDTQNRGGPAYVYRLTITAGPHVDRTYPLGGRRGTIVKVDLMGQGLPAHAEIAIPKDATDDYGHALVIAGKTTNQLLLHVDDLPEFLEAEPNDAADKAVRVEFPGMLNGRIDKPGDVDCWAVALKKGVASEFDLRGQRLGSPIQGMLTLCDDAGKELAKAEGDGATGDPVLRFTPPTDGTYFLRVSDRFRSRGGPAFAYRVRAAAPATPDFRLTIPADALTLPRGGQVQLRVTAERLGGFADAIPITIEGLPEGVTVAGNIPAKQNLGTLTLKADATAKIHAVRLVVRGAAKVGETMVTRTAVLSSSRGTPDIDSMLLGVALPTPFKIIGAHDMRWAPRGTIHKRKYRIERTGYDGPIEVCLADRQARHLQGVIGPVITVPAGATEFEYGVQLPPWMETGRTCRVCVMGVATIKDGDVEHGVSFSSVKPDEQIIVVVEPERLSIEADKKSFAAAPGKTIEVPVRVTRGKGLKGAVTIELANAVKGFTVEAVVIAEGSERGTLTLKFAEQLPMTLPTSLVLRATIMEKDQPVIGEARIELLTDR